MLLNNRFFAAIAATCLIGSVSAHAEDLKFDWNTIRPGFLLQTWLINDTATPANANPNFYLRRAQIRFGGAVTENAHWFVMADMAKTLSGTDGKFLQELGVSYTLCPGLEFTAGQFKTLTSAEGLEKDSEIILPERSIVGRTYGDNREPGAMLTYKLGAFQVGAMASNGQGTNANDTNGNKRLSVRADYSISEEIKVGAFTQAQDFGYQIGSSGANFRLGLGDLLLSAEGVIGTDFVGNTGINNNGFQGTVAYLVTPMFQPVFRFESLTGNTNAPSRGNGFTFGLNYFVSKHNAKVQAAYTYLNNFTFNGNKETYVDSASGSVVILAFQAAL